MSQSPQGLEQRVARLERELALVRLQIRSLQQEPPADVEAEPGAAPMTEPPIEAAASVEAEVPAERAATSGGDAPPAEGTEPPAPPASSAEPDAEQPASEFAEFEELVAGPAHPPTEPAREPEPAEPRGRVHFDRALTGRPELAPEAQTLERRIGGQLFAIAGALIIIIGLGLGVKFAIDNHWFDKFPPALRCLGIAGLGVVFLGAGEYLRTRVHALAVAGCNAVGIASLYIAGYTAFHFFNLIPSPVAFAFMACSAAVGLAIALRHGFLSTALLSLVGAYLVPVLLAEPDASPYVLPVYLLILSGVSLTLAVVRPRPFGPMRDAAWFGSGLLGLLWTFGTVGDTPWLVLVFWALTWTLHQGELLVTASRGNLLSPPEEPRRQSAMLRRRVEPVLLAIATTAGVVTLAAIILEHHLGLPSWLAPAAGLAVTGAIALVHGGHLRVLRDKPRTDLETLAAAHAAQAGALLVVTIALALQGWAEATAWLAMGVAAVLAARWIAARSLEIYGVVLLSIATVRVCTYDLFVGPASVPWTTGAPLVLAPWTVLVLAAGSAWMLVAVLMLHASRDEEGNPAAPPRPIAATVCAVLAAGLWLLAPAHPDSTAGAVCVAWLVLSVVLAIAARLERRLHLAEVSLVAACATVVPWVIASDMEMWLRSDVAIGAHPGLWLGAAVAAVLAGHAWAVRRWADVQEHESVWLVLSGLAGGVMLIATSFEVARGAAMLADDVTARRAALSIWWGLWGVSMVVLGFWKRTGPVRYVGLALMSVAAFKAVLLDLAGVPQLWRVASFIGLGGLMLGVAVLYGRVSATLGVQTEAVRSPRELE